MFEKEIKFIADFSLNKVKKLGSFFTFEKLLTTDLHPAIIQFISAELDYLIHEDRNKLLQQSAFDYSGPEILKYFNLISQEIKKNKRISYEDFRKLVIQAVSFNVNYLVRPKWSLSKIIFNDKESQSVQELKLMLHYIYYYDYIKNVFSAYLSKRKIINLSLTEFELIMNKIDRELFKTQPEKLIDNALYSIADFFNEGGVNKSKVSVGAIELFLKEKNLMDKLIKLRKVIPSEDKQKYDVEEIRSIIYSTSISSDQMDIEFENKKDETKETESDKHVEEIELEEEGDKEIKDEEEKKENAEFLIEEDEENAENGEGYEVNLEDTPTINLEQADTIDIDDNFEFEIELKDDSELEKTDDSNVENDLNEKEFDEKKEDDVKNMEEQEEEANEPDNVFKLSSENEEINDEDTINTLDETEDKKSFETKLDDEFLDEYLNNDEEIEIDNDFNINDEKEDFEIKDETEVDSEDQENENKPEVTENVLSEEDKKDEVSGDEEKIAPQEIEKDIFSYLEDKEMEKIIVTIFNDDREDFANTMEKISECNSYEEAVEILKGVFFSYRVSPYAREAVSLTNVVSFYFNQAK